MNRNNTSEIFSKNLDEAMFDVNITPKELARRTGISVKTIQRYLEGTTVPNLYNLAAIAEALDTKPLMLLVE